MGLIGAMRSAERDGGDPLYPLYSNSDVTRGNWRPRCRALGGL